MDSLLDDATEELDIFIELPENVMRQALQLNQRIAQVLNDIENTKNIYHITLYQGRFKKNDISSLINALQVALKIKPIHLQLEPSLHRCGKHIWWNVINNDELKQLHENVLAVAMTKRVGIRQSYQHRYDSLSKKEKQLLDNYGALNIKDDFKPHVTLFYGSNNDVRISDIIKNIKPKSIVFDATTIAVGKIGHQGNVLLIVPESTISLHI